MATPSRTQRFLDAFNQIESALRTESPGAVRLAFHALVDQSRALVGQQKRRLKDIGDLRNAIVHSPGGWGGDPIAEPREDIVAWLESQVAVIERPPLVREALKLAKPVVLSEDDDISRFLAEVRDHDFSQSPVRLSDGTLALVTTNSVARWIASGYSAGHGVLLEHASVREVLTFAEEGDSVLIRPRSLTAVEAARLFAGSAARIPPIAIILTESGQAHETPLGLCVRGDVADVLKSLGV